VLHGASVSDLAKVRRYLPRGHSQAFAAASEEAPVIWLIRNQFR
jgi:hypothetical protein